ncbi:hypothetical protein [Paenibacillus piri]|uniref:hypothetical protein n=1 Tax=Paenibacillus piri TaxID=2547395 RepID=UPI001FEC18B3|nr:hypothetical protein [Paenibacillus piri]
MYWDYWSIDRILVLLVSLAFLMLGSQVSLFHYRQNFHHASMGVPAIAVPLFFIAGIILTWLNAGWLHQLFHVFMWLGGVAGLIGFYFHVRGVGHPCRRVCAVQFHDRMACRAAADVTALSILGRIAIYRKGM